jgi:hypothetical protein
MAPNPFFPLIHFRATCLRALGFDGFFDESLDESIVYKKDTLALMLPKSYFESGEYAPMIPYLTSIIELYGWKCESIHAYETNTYTTERRVSRHRTQILGPHILFRIVKERDLDTEPTIPYSPPPIELPNWTVVRISYNSLKPEGSFITFNKYLHEAAFPADFVNVYESLKEKALEDIQLVTAGSRGKSE